MSAADGTWAVQVQPEILQSVDVEDIESALRGCLLKLQYANASLGPCKEGAFPCNDASKRRAKNILRQSGTTGIVIKSPSMM